jgi:hypothetical protein
MKRATGDKVISMGRFFKVTVLVASGLFLGGLVATYLDGGVSVYSVGFGVCSIIACAAIVEAFTGRVVLTDDALRIVLPWRQKTYPRPEILSVTWEAGCPVTLKMVSGGWVKLPPVGRTSQGVVNSIRAWLKRGAGDVGHA